MSKLFPKSANRLPLQIIVFVFVLGGIVTAATNYYATPKYTRVGYAPTFSRWSSAIRLHAGNLGIDCRYCHSNVEKSGHSNIPTSQTCMNCHSVIKANSPSLEPVRTSYESGDPVPWVNVHVLPNYAYFNHSCTWHEASPVWNVTGALIRWTWSGTRNRFPWVFASIVIVSRKSSFAHRNSSHGWTGSIPKGVQGQIEQGKKFVHDWNVKPPQSCSGCHR
jgi:hypothetical protein